MCAVLAATHIRSDQLPGFDDAYRTHQPQAEPLNWNTPIGKEQSLTLGDFLHSLLDQHINGNLCAGNVEWLLSLVRELLGKYGDTNVPVSRQEYTRLIDLLKDNARFYLTCASHCCPCAAQTQECPVCKGPLFKDNKPAGLFFVRDPREWVKRLRQGPVLAKAMTYPIMRLKDCAPDASLEDVWDGELFTWLMAPNAEPLFRPRPDPLPVSFRACLYVVHLTHSHIHSCSVRSSRKGEAAHGEGYLCIGFVHTYIHGQMFVCMPKSGTLRQHSTVRLYDTEMCVTAVRCEARP